MNSEGFTGSDVRNIRKKHGLNRKQMGELLGVAAVTIEKWELTGDRPIRHKYHNALDRIVGLGAGAGIVGVVAAPVVLTALPLAGLLGIGALTAKKAWDDTEIDRAEEVLRGLRRLTPEERETWLILCKKMAASA